MISLIGIVVCILAPAFVLQVLILKGTTFIFRKRGLTWRVAILVTLITVAFGICSSILGRFISGNILLVVLQLLCILGLFALPAILIRNSLRITTFASIGIVVVAIIVSSIVGIGYAYGI